MDRFQIGPFLGLATTLDQRIIEEPYASDSLNCRGAEAGYIAPRYGFKKLSSGTIPANFKVSYRMDYLAGYSGTNVFIEEYPLVEEVTPTISTTVTTGTNSVTQTLASTTGIQQGDSLHFATANVNATVSSVTNGTVLVLASAVSSTTSEVVTLNARVLPYIANATTGARTENKAGTSHLPLQASKWSWFSYNGYGYGTNKDASYPIIRYTMGTTNTLANVNVAADPTTAETYTSITPNATTYPSNPGNYKQLAWTNAVNTTDIAYTGIAAAGRSYTCSSATSTTISQGSVTWNTNEFVSSVEYMTVTITGGTGSGQTRTITANTGSALTVSVAFSPTPDNTSTFRVNTTAASRAYTGSYLICNAIDNSATGAASFTIDFTNISGLGVQDFTNSDKFQLSIHPYIISSGAFGFSNVDPSSWSVTLISSGGTTYTPQVDRDTQATVVAIEGTNYTVPVTILTMSFAGGSTAKPVRSAWSTIQKISVSYTVIGYSSQGSRGDRLMVRPLTVGGVNNVPPNPKPASDIALTKSLKFGYTYKSSTTNFESGIGGIVSVPFVPDLQGLATQYAPTRLLGSNLTLKGTVSADSTVDSVRFYVQDDSGVWRFIGSSANSGTPSVTYALTWTEVLALTAYSGNAGTFPYAGIKKGVPMRGWVLWLCQGGISNLKHSGVGNPLRIYNANTDASSADQTRPANYTLADNFGDEPLNAFPADDAILIMGNQGVYAQVAQSLAFAQDSGYVSVGFSPSTLTPPKKLPGSQGCAGEYACCRWHDEMGNAGAAWMAQDGEIWFGIAAGNFDGLSGFRLQHLTAGVKGLVRTWLLEAQASFSDLSTAMMGIDEAADALWVVMGANALVLRRPSLVDGARQWEKYQYNLGGSVTFASLAFSPGQRLRAVLSDGRIVELEYSSTSTPKWAYQTGTNIDDGSAMPAGYWQSKYFVDNRPNRRALAARLERDTLTDTPTVTIYTSKQPNGAGTVGPTSGNTRFRFPLSATGPEHKYKINFTEGMAPIRRLVPEEAAAGAREKK